MEIALTPLEFARRTRKLHPDREAVVDGELRLTYRQFFERCDRWSHVLQRLGIRPGDRVACITPNSHAHLESFYAVPQIGAATVPINHRLGPSDFAYILNHSGARVVCVHADHCETLEKVRDQLTPGLILVIFNGTRPGWISYEEELRQAPATFSAPEIRENDILSINYTSGTTSKPKGVMITHRNAWMNIVGTLVHFHMTCRDKYLWTVPMFHANGWTFVWTVTAVGGLHVNLGRPDPKSIFDLIRREAVTLFCAAPTVLIGIANAPADLRNNVRRGVRVLTAGAPPAAATIQRVEEELGWEITQVYGLTEVSPFISICEPRPEHDPLNSTERARIKARQGVELLTSGDLRVVNEQCEDVPHDGRTLGEIVVRGNVVMAGYHQDPEATAAATRGGWFWSGDAAVVHPDGYVEIRDRFKDVIISGGENISSVEVEGCLLQHPAVQEVAVVGVPSEKWGESPHAFVVLKSDARCSPEELRDYCRSHLAHFKVPAGFTFVTELPKTATGKIQKYILRAGRPNIASQ